jgi:aryl-alcohol dehydrogenase-like predicted oxidoreductase
MNSGTVERRRLGRTGLAVSCISLGTVELGMDYGVPVEGQHLRPTEAQATELLNLALDWGINFIDTARVYGTSEEVIGRALGPRRDEYILASKVALPPGQPNLAGAALRRWIDNSISTSLRALQTDVIDVLKIHSASLEVIRRGEAIEVILDARRRGLVRYTGVSTYGEPATLAALSDGRYDCVQIAYNLLDRRFEERVLPLAIAGDIGVVVRSVLLRGVISPAFVHLPAQLAPLRAAIARLAALRGVESLPELAYRYVMGQAGITTALVGTARPAELEAALGFAARGPLPDDLQAQIRCIEVLDPALLNPGNWPAREDAWGRRA